MKIEVSKIPFEGVTLNEEISPQELELETEIIKFRSPVNIEAQIWRITNAVSADLKVGALISANCSRCLDDLEIVFKKNIRLSYPVESLTQVIDLGPDIREEIMLDYPIKPLCKKDCKGLCPKCGKDLNESNCNCNFK